MVCVATMRHAQRCAKDVEQSVYVDVIISSCGSCRGSGREMVETTVSSTWCTAALSHSNHLY